ncbi:hypothetical protein K2173_015825 [Erythroxylum novogranatense]|uniref:RING-type E3 ubiquitin transferase n=1 Tax=Erythroxylum novogranatense TaxID=1862640 RepID=A0AAV8SF37_9ROSI|nr:hypothetical protein K2173_015825 [Erythroxylum novogranatense]
MPMVQCTIDILWVSYTTQQQDGIIISCTSIKSATPYIEDVAKIHPPTKENSPINTPIELDPKETHGCSRNQVTIISTFTVQPTSTQIMTGKKEGGEEERLLSLYINGAVTCRKLSYPRIMSPDDPKISSCKVLILEFFLLWGISPYHLVANPPEGDNIYTPPKDFVYPIISHLFDDHMTLERGQTYECRAIKEWMKLHITQLPKTNYVLKRLITSWQEQQLADQSFKLATTSPNTITSQAIAINNLCISEILLKSKMAILQIERLCKEILFNSDDPVVLKATVLLFFELGSRDNGVIQTLTRVDSDVECIVALFRNSLVEATMLIYPLRPFTMNLLEMDLTKSLLMVIKMEEKDMFSGKETIVSSIANAIISTKMIDKVVRSLVAQREDGKCKNTIADQPELTPVLGSFSIAIDREQFVIIHFLSKLVKLNRRTFNKQVLHIIKYEGSYSTMQNLLNFLQTAPQEQCAVAVGLLLQLDLLVLTSLLSVTRTIVSSQRRFIAYGKFLTIVVLLKQVGLDRSYKILMSTDNLVASLNKLKEEERADEDWERKIMFAPVSHEFGLLFETLSGGLKNTGIRGAARVCLLKSFVAIFKSAKDINEVLSFVALKSFIPYIDGLCNITFYLKDIKKGLRELRKSSRLVFEIIKVSKIAIDDLWNHKELALVDCSENGEAFSIANLNDKIFSGHSDGTIKVHSWNGGSKLLNQAQYVNCLVLAQGKLYCGCQDSSIQIWSTSNFDLVGTLSTTMELRTMVISSDIIYLGSRGGTVEIWDQKKHTKIEVLQTATNAKVLCMTLDTNEEVLVIGISDNPKWNITCVSWIISL